MCDSCSASLGSEDTWHSGSQGCSEQQQDRGDPGTASVEGTSHSPGQDADEYGKDYVERDERRLAELGRRAVEMYAIAHIFGELAAAHSEAESIKRQDALIKEVCTGLALRQGACFGSSSWQISASAVLKLQRWLGCYRVAHQEYTLACDSFLLSAICRYFPLVCR